MIANLLKSDSIDSLNAWAHALHDKAKMSILLDGAFLPGIWREVRHLVESGDFANLFSLNGASDTNVLDLSPIIFGYDPYNLAMNRLLHKCSAYPMISSIVSPEPLLHLANRLRSWCIVEHGGQRLNLRYADTRRLPDIVEVLSSPQCMALIGPAYEWKYIGRTGEWESLKLPTGRIDEAEAPYILTDAQFGKLVDRAEPDQILSDPAFLRRAAGVASWTAYGVVRHALSLIPWAEGTRSQRLEWCGMHMDHFKGCAHAPSTSWGEFMLSEFNELY